MFTGIIEETGRIRDIRKGTCSALLSLSAQLILTDLNIGDSVAVNGVCLTVTTKDSGGFTADVMPETLRCSNLGALNRGSMVNLERALTASGRLGGHLVSGHIDGVGQITACHREDNALWYQIVSAPSLLRYMVAKGSVALDGISLTLAEVTEKDFSVSLIPHTAASTTLGRKGPGDKVNIETDILGKYVAKLLEPAAEKAAKQGVTLAFLTENGF